MDAISNYLELKERKKKRIIRTILGFDASRKASKYPKVLNSKMISSKKDLNYEQCLELKITENQAKVFIFIDEYCMVKRLLEGAEKQIYTIIRSRFS